MTYKTIRIALLLCDHTAPQIDELVGDYPVIFERWLVGALETYPDEAVRNGTKVHLDAFDVVGKLELPALESLTGANGYDVVMLSGSKHTVHELHPPFIPRLIEYMRDIATHPDLQHLKIVGICFGHQIMAHAMGGTSQRGDKGWEMGVHGAQVTEEGREMFPNFGDHRPRADELYIQQMHRDVVPAPPPGFVTCLRTEKYPVQAMVKYHSPNLSRKIPHIFTIQGHPEFIPEVVHEMVEIRAANGIIDEETAVESRRRVWGKDKQGGEGLGCVGWSVWRMILSGPP